MCMTADINKKHLMHLNKYNTCLEKKIFIVSSDFITLNFLYVSMKLYDDFIVEVYRDIFLLIP